MQRLPHRYPMLLVDRVLELEAGKRIKALKNVTINEPFFTGHFPHMPVAELAPMLEKLLGSRLAGIEERLGKLRA